ncbi:DNL-type domain-containing protein [Hirschfeldia incana]|nr:DNL-type domain-containing protein [Hirschfeldia incana]
MTRNMANTVAGLTPVIAPIYSPITNRKPISFYKPHILPYKPNPISSLHSSRTARVIEVARKQRNRPCSVFGCLTDEEESKDSSEVASVDIKLPRRSLLVEFSCNSCGERTKRLINRLAYERGLVFVQCGGCLKHHKLVDNLGLIVEYDFRQETSKDLGLDQR